MESTRTTHRTDAARCFNQAIEYVESLFNGSLDQLKLPQWLGCQADESPKAKMTRRAAWFASGLVLTMLLCSAAPGYYSSVGTKGLRTKPYASIGFAGVANGIQSRHLRSVEQPAAVVAAQALNATNGFVADPMSAIGASLSTVPAHLLSDSTDSEIRPSLTIFQQLQNTMPFKNHLAFLLRTIGRGCQFAGTIAFITGFVAWVRGRFERRLGLIAFATAALAYGLPEVIRVLSLFSLGVNPFI